MSETETTTSGDFAEDVDEEAGTFDDFMGSVEEQMTDLIQKTNSQAPKDMREQWLAFSSAINWNETWLQCLLAFHVLLFVLMLLFRKNVDFQTFLFFFIMGLVYFSENINSYCAMHWREFSTQNYFDGSGVFSGILFSGPLLIILLCQLVRHEIQLNGTLFYEK